MSREIDKGAFIANGYTIENGIGGTFIAIQGGTRWRSDGMLSSMRGFSTYQDLLSWLAEEHAANATRQDSKSPETSAA